MLTGGIIEAMLVMDNAPANKQTSLQPRASKDGIGLVWCEEEIEKLSTWRHVAPSHVSG